MTSTPGRTTLVTSALAAALCLGGCGARPVTRAGVIARGNAICATASRAVEDLGPGPAGDVVADLAREAPIYTREAQQIGALPVPANGRRLFARMRAAEVALASGYRRLAALQRAGEITAARSELGALEANDAAALAERYGMRECAGVVATVR